MTSELVSIVTPVLNCEKFLAPALASVHFGDHAAVEIIVVDGGSTDRTCAIASDVAGVRVIRQPGTGLYDALNHGIRHARGSIIGFLNGDDVFCRGAIAAAVRAFAADPAVEVVTGPAEVFRDAADGETKLVAAYADAGRLRLSPENVMRGVPLLNTRFYRQTLLQKFTGFDVRYQIAADRELLIRMAVAGVSQRQIPDPVYRYRAHAGSMTMSGDATRDLAMALEHLRIAADYMDGRRYGADVNGIAERWYFDSVISALYAAMRCGQLRRCVSLLLDATRRGSGGWWKTLRAASGKLWRRGRRHFA